MRMFSFGKKNEERKAPACACSCGCPASESTKITPSGCGETAGDICCIKVLGMGCASCHQLYENTKTAAKNMGLSVEVEYVTDMQKIMEYGVMSVPALVVNENVVAMGKVMKANEIEQLLHRLGF